MGTFAYNGTINGRIGMSDDILFALESVIFDQLRRQNLLKIRWAGSINTSGDVKVNASILSASTPIAFIYDSTKSMEPNLDLINAFTKAFEETGELDITSFTT